MDNASGFWWALADGGEARFSTLEGSKLATFVLVHGAWGGAWIWRRILSPLRQAGHTVHAVTLTGDGERAHLRHAGIGLRDHINDVVQLIKAEELSEVVLVGHSYGGMVITGVPDAADALDLPRPVISKLVYVDAVVPRSGECWSTCHDPQVVASRTAQAALHDHALPPPDPQAFGLEGLDRAWLLRRQVPHPFGPYQEPLYFGAQRWANLPRTFIDCTRPAFATIQAYRQRVREASAAPAWTVREIATGHCPMVSAPQALVQCLLEAAA